MRRELLQELHDLDLAIVDMATNCEIGLKTIYDGIKDADFDKLKDAREYEQKINANEREVEDRALNILLKQQPVATDLRRVSSSLRIVADLERIGDQMEDISEIAGYYPEDRDPTFILEMLNEVMTMLHLAVDAFIDKDENKAEDVVDYDRKIDALFVKNRDIVIESIENKEVAGAIAVDYIMTIKYLERIGDHCENIAQWVQFIKKGELP